MTVVKFDQNVLEVDNKKFNLDFNIDKVIAHNKIYIVLFDPYAHSKSFGQFPNLIGVNYEKGMIWTAELPTTDSGDCYYDFCIVEDKICAYSWRSYDCYIDVNNGKILDKVFTK